MMNFQNNFIEENKFSIVLKKALAHELEKSKEQ